jgi:hypothetical protein
MKKETPYLDHVIEPPEELDPGIKAFRDMEKAKLKKEDDKGKE